MNFRLTRSLLKTTDLNVKNKSIAMYSNKASLEAAAETLHQQQIKVQNQKESEKKTKRSLKELVLKYGATAVAVYIVLSSIAFVALLVVVKMQQLTPVEIENFVVKMLSYLPSFGNEGEQEEEKKGSYILHFFEGYNISESQAQKITDVAVAVVLTE
ncbi:hypothetical protein HK099_003494 [Clydaea vesicula]|uniref:DUF1279 domain-containing protein n=1 Tax=Clydaea vesicula TaxID=447962 RepID=A0AAD5U3B4_9FUNG|nr:hypothetical protein HK099_003494 [Clydaea vesicula]